MTCLSNFIRYILIHFVIHLSDQLVSYNVIVIATFIITFLINHCWLWSRSDSFPCHCATSVSCVGGAKHSECCQMILTCFHSFKPNIVITFQIYVCIWKCRYTTVTQYGLGWQVQPKLGVQEQSQMSIQGGLKCFWMTVILQMHVRDYWSCVLSHIHLPTARSILVGGPCKIT